MHTHLSLEFEGTEEGEEAAAILRKCVHCGFCNATCPTYQLLGDELDGPRGRLYLVKQLLEGGEVTRSTQQHLDRCLTCGNCERTCPSGVEFVHLIDIGRGIVDEQVRRPLGEGAVRWMLKEGLTSPLFAPALTVGRLLRPLLPDILKDKVPAQAATAAHAPPASSHRRRMLMQRGCVQPALMPNIDRATARVLDAAGIESVVAAAAGCCGALRRHLSDEQGSLREMRRNIDAWWPMIGAGDIEAIVSNASACGLALKEYGYALKADAAYAERAARISALTRDLAELLPELVVSLKERVRIGERKRLVFHSPCTLQHGQQLHGVVEEHLRALGFDVSAGPSEGHLCCGSAGTYSLLQPQLARQLRDRKLKNLAALEPRCIVTANVGCLMHLQSGTSTPVRHWVEVLEEALGEEAPSVRPAAVPSAG